jgi:hypothetical protein
MNCTIRNFIDGCILDAHPLMALFSIVIVLAVLGCLYLCVEPLVNPPKWDYEEERKRKEKDRNALDSLRR